MAREANLEAVKEETKKLRLKKLKNTIKNTAEVIKAEELKE